MRRAYLNEAGNENSAEKLAFRYTAGVLSRRPEGPGQRALL
jgi:hypothetical protein